MPKERPLSLVVSSYRRTSNMRFIILIASATLALAASASNDTDTQNKSKRGVVEQTQVYGEAVGYKPYQDPVPAAASVPNAGHYFSNSPLAVSTPSAGNYYSNAPKATSYVSVQEKPVYENAETAKVNSPQVSYYYQQPHGPLTSPNINANQHFQSLPQPTQEMRQNFSPDVRPHFQQSAPVQDIRPQYSQPSPIIYGNQVPVNVIPITPFHNQPQSIHNSGQHHNNYPSETAVTPVQHHTTINHGIYNPVPTIPAPHIQPTYTVPKLNYNAGKFIYNPLPVQTHQQAAAPNNHALYTKNQGFTPMFTPYKTLTKLNPPSPVAPNVYAYQLQHTKPLLKQTEAPLKDDNKLKAMAKEVKKTLKEVDDDDEYERSNLKDDSDENLESEEHYEEEEDDHKPYHSSRYRHNDDDDDSHESYEENEKYEQDDDEDDHHEDSRKGSSKYYRTKPQRYTKSEERPYSKYETNDNFKFRESYKTKSKYGKPSKDYYKSYDEREPKSHYKAHKYTKSHGKPSFDSIDAKQSQNVPMVHNKKLYKEKWFVSKSHDMSE